jgi:hypothetical protein
VRARGGALRVKAVGEEGGMGCEGGGGVERVANGESGRLGRKAFSPLPSLRTGIPAGRSARFRNSLTATSTVPGSRAPGSPAALLLSWGSESLEDDDDEAGAHGTAGPFSVNAPACRLLA